MPPEEYYKTEISITENYKFDVPMSDWYRHEQVHNFHMVKSNGNNNNYASWSI